MAAAAALSTSSAGPSTGPSSAAAVLSVGPSVPSISFFGSAAFSAGPSSAATDLWLDSFIPLFKEIDACPRSSSVPESLASKITLWFRSPVSGFRPCSEASAIALESQEILVGSQRISVLPQLRDIALKFSRYTGLDQVQSYILVNQVFLMKTAACNLNCEEIVKEVETQLTMGDTSVVIMGEEASAAGKRLSGYVAGTCYIVRSIEILLNASNCIRRSIDEMFFDEADAYGTTGWAKIFPWGILTAIETRVTVGEGADISYADGEKWDRVTDWLLMLRAGNVALSKSCADAIFGLLDEHPIDVGAVTVDMIIDRLDTDVRLRRILDYIRETERADPNLQRERSTLIFANRATSVVDGTIPDLTKVTVTSAGVHARVDSRSASCGMGRHRIMKRLDRLKDNASIVSVLNEVKKAFTVATLEPSSGGRLVIFGAYRDLNDWQIVRPWVNESSTELPDPQFNLQVLIDEEKKW